MIRPLALPPDGRGELRAADKAIHKREITMLYGIRNSSGAFNVFADRRDADKHFRNERKSYIEIGNTLIGPFDTYEDASYEIVCLRKEGYRDDMRVVGMKA